jgi:hypothetical protein
VLLRSQAALLWEPQFLTGQPLILLLDILDTIIIQMDRKLVVPGKSITRFQRSPTRAHRFACRASLYARSRGTPQLHHLIDVATLLTRNRPTDAFFQRFDTRYELTQFLLGLLTILAAAG